MCRVETETNNLGTSKWYYCQGCQICLEKILRVGNTAFKSSTFVSFEWYWTEKKQWSEFYSLEIELSGNFCNWWLFFCKVSKITFFLHLLAMSTFWKVWRLSPINIKRKDTKNISSLLQFHLYCYYSVHFLACHLFMKELFSLYLTFSHIKGQKPFISLEKCVLYQSMFSFLNFWS